MDGSYSAVIARFIYKKPLIVRTGYTASIFARNQNSSSIRIKLYQWMEWFAYKYADAAVTASLTDKDYICHKYKISPQDVYVFNNYIDTTIFRPKTRDKYVDRIIFVGRLNIQKNVDSLIKAVLKTQLSLDIYGGGELRGELEEMSKTLGAKVRFMGIVPNSELPEILNKYRYFILPSLYEGMPKTLLEAMACGLVCIGTDVSGINEVIEDKVNGYLAKSTSADDIYDAIMRAQGGEDMNIIKNGLDKINVNFSLEGFLEKEGNLIRSLQKVHE
ncbi:MAG: glycosyltransferase family 4 protein [Nitrospirae bacterium]|nr:glycosyltransferase family 4 protein [Nitrospirota bacterium]